MSKYLEDWLKSAPEREIQIRYDKDTDEFEARLIQCDRPFGNATAFTIDGAMSMVRDEDEKETRMFICDPCLNTRYKNQASIARSEGRCEVCGESAVCNDIPSYQLEPKQRVQTGTVVEPTPQERIDRAAAQINEIMSPIAEDPLGKNVSSGDLMNSLAEVLETLGKL